jgi:hypothetical protein
MNNKLYKDQTNHQKIYIMHTSDGNQVFLQHPIYLEFVPAILRYSHNFILDCNNYLLLSFDNTFDGILRPKKIQKLG